MVLNAAVQMIREAEELKQNISKFKSDVSMLQERSLWSTQQQLQKIYQKVLVLDLDYALDKKVEQDLWNVGFKQQIEALQNISKDRKNPLRSEGQAMLSWVLQAAAGFYLCLLHQICTAFKLDLPFRRRASLLGWVEGWSPGAADAGARLPPPAAARYICQHCLVHLGDLARYRQQPRVAYTFYRHALVVSTHSGQPYNQLGLLARRRGRRLGALYWHVRAVLVRAPFPPAPNNLLRTLQQHASHSVREGPVLPGMRRAAPAPPPPAPRLDAHAHVTELMRALYMIHTLDNLEFAGTLVDTLNSSLTSLVATDCFESMTLIKMVCVIIWLVHSSTEGLRVEARELSAAEAAAAALAQALAAGALLALLLPARAADAPPPRALPALKVLLQWAALHPPLLGSAPFLARPQLWHALAHTLNRLRADSSGQYDTVPLPEDEELHGFQPLEQSFKDLRFLNHATWDTYGRRVPDVDDDKQTDDEVAPASVVSPACLSDEPELEAGVRAHRLIELGKRLAALRPEQFAYTTEGALVTFSALCAGGEQLSLAVAQLQAAAAPRARDDELDSEDDAPLPAPVVISEADFREKVREKRVGILKPQGSLERAREERAMATTDDQVFDGPEECPRGDDRREARRPRVNIAMAAILRKQEESCKQVKFRTPPPVADKEADTPAKAESAMERTKIKQQKSLADIPVGRKTGGILALKDKSGYPHLVNVASEASVRKAEEPQVQRDPKVIQPPPHSMKRDGPQSKWQQPYELRPSHRNYGLHNAGISYNPNYQAPSTVTSQNIRLPVVNPKEIDVRSAALQKQSGRGDYPPRPSYPVGGDKKSFMDDLPPRFANQRWSQDTQQENKFRDDFHFNANSFSTPPPSWLNPMAAPMPPPVPSQASQLRPPMPPQLSVPPPALPDPYSPQSWWKSPPYGPPARADPVHALQQLYSSQLAANMLFSVPPPGQVPLPAGGSVSPPGYVRQSPIGPQLPARHVSPPATFNPYSGLPYPSMYDSFPQYQSRGYPDEALYQPPLQSGLDVGLDLTIRKPALDAGPAYGGRRMDEGALERAMDEALRSPSPLEQTKPEEPEDAESPAEDPGTYSLFSGAPGACDWGPMAHGQQALWGGFGPLRRQHDKRRRED